MDPAQDNSNFALEQLRTLLRSEKLSTDGRLPTERALSDTLGVSRRAVRRALDVLEAEGMVWRRQGSGTYAGPRPHSWSQFEAIASGTNVMEIMEVRLRVEPQLAQLAAVRASADDVGRMYDLIARISNSVDADGQELWDGALHRLIAQSAGNQFFLNIFDVINRVRQDDLWRSIRELARKVGHTHRASHDQHKAIVDAIAARDPMRAGEAMRRHLLTLQESLVRVTSLDHLDEPDVGASVSADRLEEMSNA